LDAPALLKNAFSLFPETVSFVGQQLGLGLSLLSLLDLRPRRASNIRVI
jgi:hypothetical protein